MAISRVASRNMSSMAIVTPGFCGITFCFNGNEFAVGERCRKGVAHLGGWVISAILRPFRHTGLSVLHLLCVFHAPDVTQDVVSGLIFRVFVDHGLCHQARVIIAASLNQVIGHGKEEIEIVRLNGKGF